MSTRRKFVKSAGALVAARYLTRAYAMGQGTGNSFVAGVQQARLHVGVSVKLEIASVPFSVNGRTGRANTVNGSIPGPVLRLREGQDAIIQVRNRLSESTSIHWHGILLPPAMDGVPGVSFAGIPAGAEFTYRFPVRQSGTYWAHSHSGGQELLGLYFPLIIDPAEPEAVPYQQDYVVMLSDWSFLSPGTIISKLKKDAGYFNHQMRTAVDLSHDATHGGAWSAIGERMNWAKMRMDPTDFADVTGFTYHYLMNGLPPESNWTGQFTPGDRIRLRFIAAGAMTYFDVRIPGLQMTVIQADGQNVQPVEVDQFRIAPGETYDVTVQPENRAYTVFAESLDRSGYTRGTLAPHPGMSAAIPPRRPRPLRSMADMGMGGMGGMDMTAKPATGGDVAPKTASPVSPVGSSGKADLAMAAMPGMDVPTAASAGKAVAMPAVPRGTKIQSTDVDTGGLAAERGDTQGPVGAYPSGSPSILHGPDKHGTGNSSVPKTLSSRLNEAGSGFGKEDGKVLTYADLSSPTTHPDTREPSRTIELHITGNMDRYMWSFDGKKYSEVTKPIAFQRGERLRMILVNDTMMEHPIHLHGMWMELESGAGANQPRKHTISVKPAERLSVAITPGESGRWAMHCHLLLHMEMGMFRVVEVADTDAVSS